MKLVQGIINCKGTETWQFLFSYVCNDKTIKELFASTLNGITAGVRCVSSILVVFNAKLTQLFSAGANKRDGEKRRRPTRVPFFASLHTNI